VDKNAFDTDLLDAVWQWVPARRRRVEMRSTATWLTVVTTGVKTSIW
jgi:hypothetical protein